MAGVGVTAGASMLGACQSPAPLAGAVASRPSRKGARVRVAFLYPPSTTFSGKPDGWWSWPGNDFDAEGRQMQYLAELRKMETRLGLSLDVTERPLGNATDVKRFAGVLADDPPDGLLLVMFYNRSRKQAELLLKAAEAKRIPVVFYVGLGVMHGEIRSLRRPGVYLIQSLDNYEAIESGLRMINARTLMRNSRLLSITETREPREGQEPFFGTTVKVVPFSRYAELFKAMPIDRTASDVIEAYTGGARSRKGITPASLENAARAHLALKRMLREERADGLTMKCLQRGMLKPCMSFSVLNGELIPAACENDLRAAYTQLLGQLLTGRPGFQHNPAFETERNHYYASHCTCATRMRGPDGPALPYLLRRFAHTNEGSCALQVFWEEKEPVTMVRYHPGKSPALDVYAGQVVKSHAMPPAGGCTTNVEIALADREDAAGVKGHHNLLFCGDYARRFRMFAQLHRMELVPSGYRGPWPL
jgi:hypothetical protein